MSLVVLPRAGSRFVALLVAWMGCLALGFAAPAAARDRNDPDRCSSKFAHTLKLDPEDWAYTCRFRVGGRHKVHLGSLASCVAEDEEPSSVTGEFSAPEGHSLTVSAQYKSSKTDRWPRSWPPLLCKSAKRQKDGTLELRFERDPREGEGTGAVEVVLKDR